MIIFIAYFDETLFMTKSSSSSCYLPTIYSILYSTEHYWNDDSRYPWHGMAWRGVDTSAKTDLLVVEHVELSRLPCRGQEALIEEDFRPIVQYQ